MKKILLPILLALTSCNIPAPPPLSYDEKLAKIMEDCRKEMAAGEYALYSEMYEKCENPQIIAAYNYHKDSRDVDIIKEALDYQTKVTRDVENNKINEEQAGNLLTKSFDKQYKKLAARQEKREAEEARLAKKAREKREAEEKRIADYYKKHPHEYQKFLLQKRQIELLEQQNQMLAEQQQQIAEQEAKKKRAKDIASIFESLSKIAESQNRASGYQPTVRCNTSYGYGSSSTTCY